MRLAATAGLAIALLGGVLAPAASASPRDHVVITGDVSVARGQTAGDVVVLDGPVVVAGHVTGDIFAINGDVTISGAVDGEVTTVAKRARLLPGARVGGDVVYSDKKPQVAPGAVVGGEVKHENWSKFGSGLRWAIRLVVWLAVTISSLVFGLALLAFAPRAAEAVWVVASERTGQAAVWAAIVFFGLPIVAIVAIVTVLGLPLGVGLLVDFVPLLALGYVASCWLAGRAIKRDRDWGRTRTFLAGWAVLRLLALVPYLGGLVLVVAAAFGLGVLLLAAWYGSNPSRVTGPPPQPAPGT